MRPHVEIIDHDDLIWHMAEFVGAEGKAKQRNMSYDEEDGSASCVVHFDTEWKRPAGVHHADTEWYLLEGRVEIGEHVLGVGGYWQTPKGVLCPPIKVTAGTRILFFREYGDWGFDETNQSRPTVREDEKLTIVHSAQENWVPVELGSPMRFDLGGTPVPGLYIKMLHRDPITGFYTRLIKAKPGWREHPLAHHPVYEEAYTLEGTFTYNYGSMYPGTYFFRPPLLRHGDFTAAEDLGTTWLVRCDGDLVDWYTEEASVEMHGKAVNWGPEYPQTMAPEFVLPVRSKSVGPMENPAHQ